LKSFCLGVNGYTITGVRGGVRPPPGGVKIGKPGESKQVVY